MSVINGQMCDDLSCTECMNFDLEQTILANGGQAALDRINAGMAAIGDGKVAAVKTRSLKAGTKVGRGYVRKMSERQRRYLMVLISERDTSNLKLLPGQTINVKEIDTMGLPAAKAVIDKLTNCPMKAIVPVRMATEGQKRYIASLNNQIQDTRIRITQADIDSVTFAEVNDVLNLLKNIIAAEKEDAKRSTPSAKPLSEGAYWHEGRIVRVQRARQSGNLYATIQVEPGVNEFEYVRGLISKVNPDNMLSHEEMKAFAAEFHQCGDCGRRLTNKESISFGIGPICRNKGYR